MPPPRPPSPFAAAVLFGWWNAHPRHLAKYADLYQRLQIADQVIPVTLPAPAIALAPALLLHPAARRLADTVHASLDRAPIKGPVVVHTFSGNGAIALALAHKYRPLLNITHRVHDSGPVTMADPFPLAATYARAMPVLRDPHVAKLAPRPAVLRAAEQYLNRPRHQALAAEIDLATRALPRCPTLIMAGTQDDIVPPSMLHTAANQGLIPSNAEWAWFESGHVEHLRRFPTEYATVLHRFLTTTNNT
ncbi:hypothetical protein AMAG_08792 [Allomyces macrogynus ATCC 38327]|uniref:AB hydrolase-1 domain-containing protein n=1 Tax=Allomyces macrogynus (strain ATCC 38327) TaxID=578462 RepID=A0A0L0SMA2_ALLM3|nr:hypothetical protein AMAG_08792 [Allomyces macrogynus ATCC 38327]|eukprot:KNE63696.1 hypothetical protein AMAG_08792 [Allomyces macrogynus ATCC 38327]